MPAPVHYHTRRRSTSPPPAPPAICRTCKETFSSRNALFSHLGKMLHYLQLAIKSVLRPIVASKAQRRKVGTGTAFKDFSYCEVRYQFSSTSSDAWGCADTGSGMSLVDESVLESGALSSRKSQSPVHIKGLGNEMYLSKESVVLDVFFPDVTNTRLAKITREFHIVQDMDCGLLIGNDIIEPEGIVMDLAKKRMRISSCGNMVCQLRVRRKNLESNPNRIVVRCAEKIVVRKNSYGIDNYVQVRFPKLDQEYPFKEFPDLPKNCFVAALSISPETTKLCVYNYSGQEFILPKDYKLGYIELPETPQYTPVKPVDVVQCHFRKVAEPDSPRSSTVTNEVATVSNKATSPRQVANKTSSTLEKVPVASPKRVRCPPSLRTFVPPSPVYSSRSPLRRSPFFFYRPQYFSFSFPPPSTTYQGNNDRLGPYSYLLCRRPRRLFPPKPGLQLPPLVNFFTCATNC